MVRKASQERLQDLFDYDPATGELVRRVSVRGHGEQFVGGRPKSKHKNGYYCVNVDSVKFLYHRVVWAWHYGEWPDVIDHADGDKTNNRVENLRACSQSQNLCNSQTPRDSKTGIKGVSANSSGNWRARVGLHGKQYHLGSFGTPQEAAAVAAAFRERLHKNYTNHGTHIKDKACHP